MKDVEIEIKVRISNSTRLTKFLRGKATFIGELAQTDEYFNPPHRDFLDHRPVEEWLRLRTDQHGAITYKYWHYDDAGKVSLYADEYETTVGDPATLRKIFLALNFKPLITVDKTRRIWSYQDYEIALDQVKNLGDFIELEYKGNNPDAKPKDVTDGMVKFLKDIGCGTIERSFLGYPMMLLNPSEMRLEPV